LQPSPSTFSVTIVRVPMRMYPSLSAVRSGWPYTVTTSYPAIACTFSASGDGAGSGGFNCP
jgi:hypothetical protein